MSYSVVVAVSYTAYLVLLLTVSACKNYKVTRVWYVILFVWVLALANMAYHLIPHSRLDLYQLQKIVNDMRISDNSARDLILEGVGEGFDGLITFNILCYIVSLMGNRWLSTISVLITISLLMYVVVTYIISKNYTCKALLLAICVTFMGLQMHYIFSGVRNGIATAMTIFALYRMYRHKRILLSSIVLYIIAIMMHPVVLIVAPLLAIAIYGKYQKVFRIILLFAIPIIFGVAKIFINLPNTLLQYIGNRVYFYETHSFAADRPEMIANIAIFMAVGLGYWFLNYKNCFKKQSKVDTIYTNFYYLLGFTMVGCVMKRDFINRIGYLMGILSVPLMCKIFFDVKRQKRSADAKLIGFAMFFGLLACCAKVFYDTLWVMTKWTFL